MGVSEANRCLGPFDVTIQGRSKAARGIKGWVIRSAHRNRGLVEHRTLLVVGSIDT